MSFDAAKVAHMAAYFLLKADGNINHLKLIKMLYLAERESFRKYGWSMSEDYLVSMPYGPVLSNTLKLINQEIHHPIWNKLIAGKKGDYYISLKQNISVESLEELSLADIHILDKTWEKFGGMSEFDLVAYTHNNDNCPEWENPQGSSNPISLEKLLQAVGFDKEVAKDIAERQREQDKIDNFITSL